MAWQEIAALSVVGLTAVAFAWRLIHPRGLKGRRGLTCACSGTNPRSLPTMVFKARKGEAGRVIVKMNSP